MSEDRPTAPDDLAVVTNREPYAHEHAPDGVAVDRPFGGLVTALDDALRGSAATWIAWGSGSADFDPGVGDGEGRVGLPPENPSYTLERVRLRDDLVEGYYYGYSNQVLWPVCHMDTGHVSVEPGHCERYHEANRAFAERVLATDADHVWSHDYHLALAPAVVRERDPDRTLVHYWHVPWPAVEALRVCPHAGDVLEGLLAVDHLGLQTDADRERFLDCVGALTDVAVDREAGVVDGPRGRTDVYVAPVGVDPDRIAATLGLDDADADADTGTAAGDASGAADDGDAYWRALCRRHGIDDQTVAVGVDRLDYTKGLLERLDALDHLWRERPELCGDLVYVQKAAATREGIADYRRYSRRVRDRVYEVNDAHGTDDWTPVVYVEEPLDRARLLSLYRNADLGLVTPTRDGMNLVAKEFVAASAGTPAALVLSEVAGAAEAMGEGAYLVNPFDTGAVAETVAEAATTSERERRERTATLLETVRRDSIGRWLETHLGLFDALGGAEAAVDAESSGVDAED